MALFKHKQNAAELNSMDNLNNIDANTHTQEKEDVKKSSFLSLDEAVSSYVDNNFVNIVKSVRPEIYWDASYTKEGLDYFYRFLITGTDKIVRVNSAKLTQFLAEYSTLAIAFPSDRCSTTIYSWLENNQTELDMLRSIIPYKFDTCEFSSMQVNNLNGYITSIVSSFADVVKDVFEEAMSLFLSQGGAVVAVYDKLFPLTAFVASSVEIPERKSVMGVERKGENFLVWNITNLGGKIIPVNSSIFRIPELNPENDIFRACAFLTSEMIKIHKFAPAEKIVFIDAFSTENDLKRPIIIQSIKDAVSSIQSVSILETPDATLSGMLKVV